MTTLEYSRVLRSREAERKQIKLEKSRKETQNIPKNAVAPGKITMFDELI